MSKNKVKVKEMIKAKKNEDHLPKGSYSLIARMVGCTPKYVSMVLNDKLGKYSARKTKRVERIRQKAAELAEMFIDTE